MDISDILTAVLAVAQTTTTTVVETTTTLVETTSTTLVETSTTESPPGFFDELAAGTWTEFWGFVVAGITGGAAVIFGVLAWLQSKEASKQATLSTEQSVKATEWAGIVAKAQEEANRIAQAGLRVVLRIAATKHGDLHVSVGEESSPLWIREIHSEAVMLSLIDDGPEALFGGLGGGAPFVLDSPKLLRPGEFLALPDEAYADKYRSGKVSPDSYRTLGIVYSWTEHGDPQPPYVVSVDLSEVTTTPPNLGLGS